MNNVIGQDTKNNDSKIRVYLRVSTKDQEFDSQINSIDEAMPNIKLKEQLKSQQNTNVIVYSEKVSGAKKYNRPELTRLLSHIKQNDIVVVNDISRLSRSTIDLLTIVEEIKNKGAVLHSIKDGWINKKANEDENMYTETLLGIFATFAQLERKLISRRTKEGLVAARERGRIGGRPNKINEKKDYVLYAYKNNETIADIVRQTGLSRTSIYNILRANNAIEQRE